MFEPLTARAMYSEISFPLTHRHASQNNDLKTKQNQQKKHLCQCVFTEWQQTVNKTLLFLNVLVFDTFFQTSIAQQIIKV
uniref:Uncharacterized protein n=1 Tax=Anopheles minimus TaxID=112268 RepID=A0A182WQE8_9DIPT